jgi:sugar/nucleoside kinase (ribokinase family)
VGALLKSVLPLGDTAPYRRIVGVGGIGTGIVFALDGPQDLSRNESRSGRLLDVRDYCKLHIVAHYPAVLLGARPEGAPFHVLPVGKVGADEPGRRLLAEMTAAGMDVRFVDAVQGSPTLFSVCFLYPDGSGGNITTSSSAAAAVSAADVDRAAERLDARTIALALPEAPLGVRHHLLKRAGERGALRVAALASAEAKGALASGLFADVDLLALNEDEAAALADASFPGDELPPLLVACARVLRGAQPRMRVCLTAGARGAFVLDAEHWTPVPALAAEVRSTAGAGDAFLGGVLTGLALGLPLAPADASGARPLTSAAELGALVASFSVTSPHTIHPDADAASLRAFAAARRLSFAGPLERAFGGAA